MAKVTFLLVFELVSSLVAQCTLKTALPQFRRSVYEFSVNLLPRVAQEKENHFVISTLSPWFLLASTSLGAADTTLAELKQVLLLPNHKCFINKYLNIANSITPNNNIDIVLERSSNIYVDNKLEIREQFKKIVSKNDVSHFKSISFEGVDTAARIINDYVSREMHETIDNIVSLGDLNNVLMIIVDAVFIKGSWLTPFLYEETKVSPFYNEQGIQIGNVNLMSLSSSFNMNDIKTLKAKVLELPNSKSKRYSMLLFLPFDDVPLYFVLENLKQITLPNIRRKLEENGEQEVSVKIPRFKITSDRHLKELLVDMGLRTMFDCPEARFTIISNHTLHVSNLIQKAVIKIIEEEPVVKAVKVVRFSYRSSPDEFIANRPFLFMIVDKKIQLPILTGAYSKPSLF